MSSKNYSVYLSVAIISIVVLFFHLGGVPLLDPDEPVYAETPKEMIETRDFISPRIYGEYWYDKPPMYYWLVAGAYQIFGTGDFAARFPSAALAVICALAVLYFGRRMLGQRAGMAGALVLVTSVEFFYLGKAAVTDMTLTLFLTLSLLCFFERKYNLYFLFAALATLTKGPIGLFFPVVIALIYLAVTRNLSELKRMKLPMGALIFCLVALPWYAAMYYLHGDAFIDTFLGFHNVTRFTSPEHPSGVLWYYYIPVLLIGFFPWTALLPQASYHAYKRGGRKFYELVFFGVWAFTVFLFFSIAQTKLVSYILPMYPPLALLAGWYIDQLWSRGWQKRRMAWGYALAALAAVLACGAVWGLGEMPELQTGVTALCAAFAFMALGTLVFLWKRQAGRAFYVNVAGMAALSLVVAGLLLPAAAPKFSAYQTAKQFEEIYDGDSPIYVSKFLRPGFAFYSGRYGSELVFSRTSTPDFAVILQKERRAFFVVRDIDYARIPQEFRKQLTVVSTADNKMILTIRRRK